MSEESDQGKYECVATNSDGTRYSTPANLYVRGKRGIKTSMLVQLEHLDLRITLIMDVQIGTSIPRSFFYIDVFC